MGGNGVIAVDYRALDNAKRELQKAKARNADAVRSIKSAQLKLEIDIDSSKIRAVEDNLESYYRKLNTIQTSIDTAINKIDKIEKTTREVDKRCADRIRGIGTEGSGNKQGGILGGIEGLISEEEKEFDDHPIIGDIGMAIIDGAVIIGTAAAVIIGGPEILGVGLVVGTVFAANSLINEGVKIYNNVTSGKNTGYDVMEEGFEKVLGKQAGEEAYELANIAAIVVAAPEMIASGVSLIKNGANLLKDGAAALEAFGKANVGEDLKNIDKVNEIYSETSNINKYSLSGEEHYQALKDIFGEDNVDWTSKTTISHTERLKISNWDFVPSDELYLKYKDVYNNELYFDQATGKTLYPIDDGFLNGKYDFSELNVGDEIDRFGSNGSGKFFSPNGSSYGSRALPPFMSEQPYTSYKVIKKFDVKFGKIAPWFGERGLGTQYFSDTKILDFYGNEVDATVENLLKYEYIEKITP